MSELHWHRHLAEIKDDILKMAGLVEESIDRSSRALLNRDDELARQVINADTEIDNYENLIDEKTFTLLALQQPVASDLRFLSAVTKISSHLERMGDRAVNLSFRALTLNEQVAVEYPVTLREMSIVAQSMVKSSLDSFVQRDPEGARRVCCQDDELDDLNHRLVEEVIQWTVANPERLREGVQLILAGRHIERIGDESTNVCEEVVFLVEGEIIRHHDGELNCQV